MLPYITIDPFVYSPPTSHEVTELVNFIETLLACETLSKYAWPPILNVSETAEVLAETNSFPPNPRLEEIVRLSGVNYVQVQDINRVVKGLLERLSTLETRIGITEVVVEEFVCAPDERISIRIDPFRTVFERIASLVTTSIHANGEIDTSPIVMSRHLEEDWIQASVQFLLQLTEPDVISDLPKELNGSLYLCENLDHLLNHLDPIQLWIAADGDDAYVRTLEYHTRQIRAVNGGDEITWTFGSEFLASADQHGFLSHEPKVKILLRACAETILRINMTDTHVLRSGPGAHAQQVTRYGKKAYRRDIDYEYHLHYWVSSDGIELASVGVHADMKIPDPRKEER